MGRIRATAISQVEFRPVDTLDRQSQKLELLRSAVMVLQSATGGGGSGSAQFTAIAGEALSGHRAVYVGDDGQAYYASNGSANSTRTAGITTGAASLGATATIRPEGIVTEPSWTWSGSGPVWLGSSGNLTQTPPASGYLVQIGVPIGPTSLLVQPFVVARLA